MQQVKESKAQQIREKYDNEFIEIEEQFYLLHVKEVKGTIQITTLIRKITDRWTYITYYYDQTKTEYENISRLKNFIVKNIILI